MAVSAGRVVSLVPSVTETLLAWGVHPVACTRFCEQPSIPAVGGTKNPDLSAIASLEPDLVVVNDEENRIEDAAAIEALGISVHSCSPRSVEEVPQAMGALADRIGIAPAQLLAPVDAAVAPGVPGAVRAFIPIWRRPWMSLAGDTYGSSLLASLGIGNVCADLPDRYPEVSLDQVRALSPTVVLAPSEPYAFRPDHLAVLSAEVAPVIEVDGQDLFWWGWRTPAARQRLAGAVSR